MRAPNPFATRGALRASCWSPVDPLGSRAERDDSGACAGYLPVRIVQGAARSA